MTFPHQVLSDILETALTRVVEAGLLPKQVDEPILLKNLADMKGILNDALTEANERLYLNASARESELVDVLQHIRGASSCCDVWDYIDTVVPYTD